MIFSLSMDRRRLVLAFGLFLVIFLFHIFAVSPMLERSHSLDRQIEAARKDLLEITAMSDRYITLSAGLPPGMDVASPGRSITVEVQQIAERLGISKNVQRMTPRMDRARKTVEELSMAMSGVPFQSFVDLLQRIYESQVPMNVSRARIKTGYESREMLDVEMSVVPVL